MESGNFVVSTSEAPTWEPISSFIPELWSDEILAAYKQNLVMGEIGAVRIHVDEENHNMISATKISNDEWYLTGDGINEQT